MRVENFIPGPLGKYESQRPYAKYYCDRHFAPDEMWDSIGDNEEKDYHKALRIQDRNRIFDDGYMDIERGWSIFPDGTGTCAGIMPFPGATPEMMYWWFSWFPRENLRGRMWEPKNHLAIIITRDQFEKFVDESVPLSQRTWGCHFFPIDTGVRPNPTAEPQPVRLQMCSPAEFGMDLKKIEELGKDVSIICIQVGPVGLPPATSFIHVCRPTKDGMELRSRFWYGWVFENGEPVHAQHILPHDGMVENCKSQNTHLIEEYYNLSCILPELYENYKDMPDRYEDCL